MKTLIQFLSEGTWALPESPDDITDFVKALQKPVKAKDAYKVFGGIVGDDQLYDMIDEIKEESPDTDIRGAYVRYVMNLKLANLVKPAARSAVAQLQVLLKNRYKHLMDYK